MMIPIDADMGIASQTFGAIAVIMPIALACLEFMNHFPVIETLTGISDFDQAFGGCQRNRDLDWISTMPNGIAECTVIFTSNVRYAVLFEQSFYLASH